MFVNLSSVEATKISLTGLPAGIIVQEVKMTTSEASERTEGLTGGRHMDCHYGVWVKMTFSSNQKSVALFQGLG